VEIEEAKGAIVRLDHVQVAIPEDAEGEARAFYCELLGFSELEKPEALQSRGGLWLKAGSAELHLGVEAPFRAATKAHPCFVVDRLDALVATLLAHGRPVRPDDGIPGRRRFFTDDPFGNRLEFVQV
jgi:catechol 2,3-dioxygenase-like lactoylglutathione lyase family enzyme